MNISEIARDALRNLDEHGWRQGMPGYDPARPREESPWCMAGCLHGWRLPGSQVKQAFMRAAALIADRYPDRAGCSEWAVIQFNDHPDTTEEDVRLILKMMTEEE